MVYYYESWLTSGIPCSRLQEPLGEGTSYTLWSSQRSLKRDHRRKFNRSLCGVLLGISIVLVIMGILGIIGIAVYLGGESVSYRPRPSRIN